MLKRLLLTVTVLLSLTACASNVRAGQNEAEAGSTPVASGPSCGDEFYDLPGVSEEGVQVIKPTTDCGVDIIIAGNEADCVGSFKLLQVDSPASPVEIRRHEHYTEITWGTTPPGAVIVNGEKWSFADNLDPQPKVTQLWDKDWGEAIDGGDIVKVCVRG